ncbi:MAG: TetR family transcriptional regulator [Thermoleophilia bacterium]
MAPNLARRAALADAGIRILARSGARGLTHRAVDAEAKVPIGTASNYFRSRDALLQALGQRVFQRLAPPEDAAPAPPEEPPTRDQQIQLLSGVLRGVFSNADLYIALMELRLEAIRRPALRATLTETVRRNVEADVAYHRASGLPGGRTEVVLLHLCLDGLILDQLTLPGALGIESLETVVSQAVDRLVLPTA